MFPQENFELGKLNEAFFCNLGLYLTDSFEVVKWNFTIKFQLFLWQSK